jgi:hypothetical protein
MAQPTGSMQVNKPLPPQRGFFETQRTDLWWVMPAITFVVFSIFLVYAPWAILNPTNYWHGNYLAPMYSPEIFGDSPHAIFGPKPDWWPSWLFFSPALLILWAPGGFRFTCYYYRGAYYKAFWGDPPACAVGEPRKHYLGENWIPLIVQNIHRYFLYFALIFNVILLHDAYKAFWFADGAGSDVFGIGVGSIVITLNAVFLALYSFSCHSLRHLIGGYLDKLTRRPVQKKAYSCVTCLNKYHPVYAWVSLIWVLFTDIYVRMVSMGVWTDLRIF